MTIAATFSDRPKGAAPAPSLAALGDGLHFGVSASAYHQPILGMVSKSALEEFDRSPAHYRAWLDGQVEEEPSEALAFGQALHCAVLEPAVFARTYVVEPDVGDRRFKANREKLEAFRAEHEGATFLTDRMMATIRGMQASLFAHPLAGQALRAGSGESEVTALWTDPATGLRCRARADRYVPRLKMVLDLKSTNDACSRAFGRDVFKYRYHWQHALYRAGFAAVGADVEHFVFVAVEKRPPYAIGLYQIDDAGIFAAHNRVRELLERMSTCMRDDRWPSYAETIATITTPSWVQ